ncbi:hypothetical protein DUNSADRAFT_5910 [Dunaliella salina]|uniref:Coenzyme Q-binding protein COQ10 START domain-containing protein n=1 Tax=Dunaliella salina TaxID=3046 RepID=A0ABQ7GPC8_DUNSA|nr:hypothetical protein DUNSADRAFT_5910 [Dunaliella salina]|eukprot:KAF5836463.1 hypothetical protein DUNSADRAFT_5910 [Dunaliella salina]
MGFFRRTESGSASPATQQKDVSSQRNADSPPQFKASMSNYNTACIDMHAEVSAPAHTLFSLLADPFQHAKIFSSIEGSAARLLEQNGPRKKYELDYAAKWKFWKVSGVCQNLLHLETDSEKGTVSFKLREPGFLRVYEGTWSILPVGADALNPSNRGVVDTGSSTPGLINDSARRSSSGSSKRSSLSSSSGSYQSSSSTGHASTLEGSLLAAMANPQLNSPLTGTYKVQNARSVVRVSNMMMSPKITPPYPLNTTLKGLAISQVQDMFDGLVAVTLSLEAESNVGSVGTMLMAKP